MDTNRVMITEISRNTGDNQFSMDELFYRYFKEQPLFFCQAGATDLYDRPRGRAIYEETEPANPQRGPDELNKAVEKLFAHLADNNSKAYEFEIAKYCDFQSNLFAAFIIFKAHNIITRIRVVPGKQETLTSITLMGCDENKDLWKELFIICKGYIEVTPPTQDHINIITMSDNDFYLKSIPLVNKNQQQFSYDFYNDDFQPISERVVKTLSATDECGLVLFHGDPGTGKTSYLKYLLHTVTKKKLIYLPPDLIQSLSAPSFISFLMSEASNSILLIEDAENVLRHREAGGNQAVSNILNISDGILGDVLRLQIVCTFNSKLSEIDSALLRPGRLISEYRFEKLKEDKTVRLMEKLYGEGTVPSKPEMSLAEIFNSNKMPDKTKETKTFVGFIDTNKD